MKPNQPRITARHSFESYEVNQMCGDHYETTGVTIEVTFDLGDHEAALRELDAAVEAVKAQIDAAAKEAK